MGNGAAVPSKEKRRITETEYSQLEKLCKNGYFHEHFDEYLMRVQQAIRWDALDCLELLIISGDVKKVQPLHLAAKFGKLESVEILLSAGFSGESADAEGRTPLHLCTFVHTEEAGLCACLIGLWYPRTVERYDRMGYIPIHLAAINDNVTLVTALFKVSPECIGKTTTAGKSLSELAKMHNSTLVMKWWKDRKNTPTQQSPSKSSSKQLDQVSSDRIMEIWERFFENAFKRAGVDYEDDEMDFPPPAPTQTTKTTKKSNNKHQHHNNTTTTQSSSSKNKKSTKSVYDSLNYEDLDDADYEEYLNAKYAVKTIDSSSKSGKKSLSSKTITTTPKSHKKQHSNSQKKQIDLWDDFEEEENNGSSDDDAPAISSSLYKKKSSSQRMYDNVEDKVNTTTTTANTDYILDWFQWIVYYDHEKGDYLVMQIHTKECQWLDEFVNTLRAWKASYDFLTISIEEVSTWPQPSSLSALLHSGWMIYYDIQENYCMWMNIMTTSFEQYLPLGWEESSETLSYYQLLRFEEQSEWIAPDSSVTMLWVQVLMDGEDTTSKMSKESETEEQCYYMHRMTGYTSWTAPSGWDRMIQDAWDGWICCCMESNPEALFWYDPYSGTSCWVEE